MRIGIDIDDTTFNTAKSMIKYADIFEEERNGKSIKRDGFGLIKDHHYLKSLYGWNVKTKFNFFDKYCNQLIKESEMIENANTIIKKLKNDGNIICFISARFSDPLSTKITIDSMRENDILYDELYLGIKDKISFCLDNKIDLMIDDSYETCKVLKEKGTDTILMTSKMNEQIVDNQIIRAHNWNDLYNLIIK